MRRFERRSRRRTERRIGRLLSPPSGFKASAATVGGAAFGLALGVAVVFAALQQWRAPDFRTVVVPVNDLVAIVEPNDGVSNAAVEIDPTTSEAIDSGQTADTVSDTTTPEIGTSVDAAGENLAAVADANRRDEPAMPASESAGLETDIAPRAPAAVALPAAVEMPSVEQGPPAAADFAGPPKQTRVAGLPIPPKPQWLRNAIRTPDLGKAPMIAVIMDDVGVNQRRSRQAVRLPGPLTIAFIPYGFDLKAHVADARRAGHEIIVHVPMEPLDPGADPGPNALLTSLNSEEILRRLRWDLEQIDGYVGISNHMGSRFTVWEDGMRLVMGEVRRRGLLYVDSWTHNRSLGMPLSRRFRVPNAARDIFIDHDITEAAIRRRLGMLEKIADRRGYAVGIAHPYALSMRLLEKWIVSVQARGYRLVPISAIVRHRLEGR